MCAFFSAVIVSHYKKREEEEKFLIFILMTTKFVAEAASVKAVGDNKDTVRNFIDITLFCRLELSYSLGSDQIETLWQNNVYGLHS